MTRRNTFGCVCYVTIFMSQCLLQSVTVAEKEMFTCDYVDEDYKILRLRCRNHCSTDKKLMNIKIYNVTSMKTMAVFIKGESPTAFTPPLREISYYVGGCVPGEESSCQLELLITNVDILTQLHFGCNLTCSDSMATTSTISSSLVVDRKALQEGSLKLSTTTLIILIVVIIVLFMLAVLFLSLWLRGWCRYRNKVLLYQTPPQSEMNQSQVIYGDSGSVISLSKSASKVSVRRATNESIHRMNSRSETNITGHRAGHLPPPPPTPPPKVYWRDRPTYTQQTSASSNVKVTYAQPQDAIEPDISEDGDVTSGNSDCQLGYSSQKERMNPNIFYSTVPVRSIDV